MSVDVISSDPFQSCMSDWQQYSIYLYLCINNGRHCDLKAQAKIDENVANLLKHQSLQQVVYGTKMYM